MSDAPNDLKSFRNSVMAECGFTDPVEVGIVADQSHLYSGGYHCGPADLKKIGRQYTDYSTTHTRDRQAVNWELSHGSNFASAADIGDNWPRGGRAAWLRFNNLLLSRLAAGEPVLAPLRAINFSPNGTAKKRYDTANRGDGVINSTDTVTIHTHLEWWRDTVQTPARANCLTRVLQIIRAARDNTPLGQPSAPIPPVSEVDVIYTVTGVPPGTKDVVGTPVPEHAQCLATPTGPFALTGSEFFSLPPAAQPIRITMAWSRLLQLCNSLRMVPVGAAAIEQTVQDAVRDELIANQSSTVSNEQINELATKAGQAAGVAVASLAGVPVM